MNNINHTNKKMTEQIIDGTQFNIDEIMYSAPKATPQGAKFVNIIHKKSKRGIVLSTPALLNWGLSEYVDQATGQGDGKFTFSLQFPSREYETPETGAFLQNLKDLENKIKSDALTYSKEWFGKQHKSPDVVDALWTQMLKYTKDKASGDYNYSKAPTLRIKVPQKDGAFDCEIYSEDGDKLFPNQEMPSSTPLDYLKKGTTILCLIQFAGIWFVNGKFSASWKLVQAVAQKPKTLSLKGKCWIAVNSQDKEKIKSQDVEDEPDRAVVSTIVDDSDEEQEQEEVLVPVQEVVLPPPVVQQMPVVVPPPVVQQEQVVVEEVKKPAVKKVVKKKETVA
jgi:hypothetical protein